MDVLFAAAIDERRVCSSRCLIRLKEQDLTSLFSTTVVRFEPSYADQKGAGDVSHLLHVRYSCFQVIWDYLTDALVFDSPLSH
jgi:hypothetical protein